MNDNPKTNLMHMCTYVRMYMYVFQKSLKEHFGHLGRYSYWSGLQPSFSVALEYAIINKLILLVVNCWQIPRMDMNCSISQLIAQELFIENASLSLSLWMQSE